MEVLAQRSADAADDEGPQQGDVGTAMLRQLLERWMPPSAAAESDTQAGSAQRGIWVLLAALGKRDAATAADAEGLVLLCELANGRRVAITLSLTKRMNMLHMRQHLGNCLRAAAI